MHGRIVYILKRATNSPCVVVVAMEDEALASCMFVHLEIQSFKWQLVCTFDVIEKILLTEFFYKGLYA